MKAFLPLAALVASAVCAHAQSADEQIRQVRLSATLEKASLFGNVRKDRTKTPLALFMEGQNMQFKLGNDDSNRFHVRMGDEKCTLLEVADNGKTTEFPTAKLTKPIGGTDLTYEDLTLRFLYWPNAKDEGEVKAFGEQCEKIRLDNPGSGGAFKSVYVFIHKKYHAFWGVLAYDKDGKLIKQFRVNSVMKLPDGNYTAKQMEIDTMKPGSKKDEYDIASQTYLEFDSAEQPKAGVAAQGDAQPAKDGDSPQPKKGKGIH